MNTISNVTLVMRTLDICKLTLVCNFAIVSFSVLFSHHGKRQLRHAFLSLNEEILAVF